ncbi:WD40 repeat-containing protein MSI4-like protein, partial [Tanacetum coccineum]
ADNASAGLLFSYCGHKDKVVDFQWNRNDPFTLVSLSHNIEKSGDGALQLILKPVIVGEF